MAFTFLGLPIIFSVMAVIISTIAIWGITKFILYIFQSFGLLNLARKEQYQYPYMAWVPGLSHYLIGKFCCNNKKAILYTVCTIIKLVLTISMVMISNCILFYTWLIFIIIYFVIDMLVMNQFYKRVYKQPQLFTIFTIITFGLLKPIFIYTSKIKKVTI